MKYRPAGNHFLQFLCQLPTTDCVNRTCTVRVWTKCALTRWVPPSMTLGSGFRFMLGFALAFGRGYFVQLFLAHRVVH